MELIEIMEESVEPDTPAPFISTIDSVQRGGSQNVNEGNVGRIVVKRVDKEPGACYDVEDFFRLTRPHYSEDVIEDGRVIGYDNEMVIRYLDRVIVNDDGYEVRLKGGVSVEV